MDVFINYGPKDGKDEEYKKVIKEDGRWRERNKN